MQAVILAAGRGKRLHPITISRTKAMVPIVGKPIIERVMENFVLNGTRNFILVTSPEDTEIERYFSEISSIDAKVSLVKQPEPLGMGDALLQAVPLIDGDFLLSACDNLIKASEIRKMVDIWEIEKPSAILSTLKVGPKDIERMGIVELNGNQITRIVEKPLIKEAPSKIGSVPLYIFNQDILGYLSNISPSPRGEYEIQDAIQALIDGGGYVRSVEINNRKDLTKPEDLLKLNLGILKDKNFESSIAASNIGNGTSFKHPVHIATGVIIGANCVIGPNVYIEPGSIIYGGVQLKNTVVLRNRKIRRGSSINNKVVW
jgi:dTDP-glucose pyrophosphorylase